MRVNSQNTPNLESAQGASQSKRTDKAAAAAAKSKSAAGSAADASSNAEISPRAKEMAHAKDVASRTPEVREEKIAKLKQMIAEGKYKVDEGSIAEKMIKEHSEL